ncbi:MAG: YceI family protein [Flavipsychrobacter sp.]|nr:YceI family protein [Flavipsychrobacter sp.]
MKTRMYSAFVALTMLTACSQRETKTVTETSQPEAEVVTVTPTDFKVNEESSTIEWKGNAPDHFHTGAFKVKGSLKTDGKGKITSGDFTNPVASITNFDLTDPDVREQLLNHLKSADFFNMAVHPNTTFHITKVEPYSSGSSSSVNTMITGDFTMIGQTHSVEIPAEVKFEYGKMSAEGNFKLNRLTWGMNNYNDPNSDLYILPEVDLTLKLYLDASGS